MTLLYPSEESYTEIHGTDSAIERIYEYDDNAAAVAAWTDYSTALAQSGMTLLGQNAFGDAVKSLTYTDGENILYTYYTAGDMCIRTIVSKRDSTVLAPTTAGETVDNAKAPEIAQLGLNYLNGMSYVLTLDDGSFLIYDGGTTQADADLLWNYLVDKHGGESGIKICAWVITHAHEDHYQAFELFMTEHGNDVALEYLFYNGYSQQALADVNEKRIAAGASAPINYHTFLIEDIKKLCPNTKHVKVHTGQTITVRNATIDILYTHEDFYNHIGNYANADANDFSIISRVTLGGKKILMTADAFTYGLGVLYDYYKDTDVLKCDIVQVPHHGDLNNTEINEVAEALIALMNKDSALKLALYSTTTTAYAQTTGRNKADFNTAIAGMNGVTRIFQDGTAVIDLSDLSVSYPNVTE